MANTSLFFHLHAPLPLRSYAIFDVGTHGPYFDRNRSEAQFAQILDQVLSPWTESLERLGQRHGDRLRVAVCFSGLTLERLEAQAEGLLRRLLALGQRGQLEWVATPYYHSLSFLHSRGEFMRQVQMHREKLFALTGQETTTFYQPAGIYGNPLGYLAGRMAFTALISEGAGRKWGHRSPQYLHNPADLARPALLLRQPQRSDDWQQQGGAAFFPPAPEPYARYLAEAGGQLSLLCLDLARLPFGPAQQQAWEAWVDQYLHRGEPELCLPSQVAAWQLEGGTFDAPDFVSQAAPHFDLSPWQGQVLQQEALEKLYQLEGAVQAWQDDMATRVWSLLQQAQLFAHMGPQAAAYDSPFATPQAAYLTYMNVLADFQLKLGR